MQNDRIFLTGATGFLGAHVARELLAAGYRVRALRRASSAPPTQLRAERAELQWVEGDLRDAGSLRDAMVGCRYLMHCAALYSFAPRDRALMHAVNVRGTASLLEAAALAGVERAVVTSSSATLFPHLRHSAYHASKLEQERAALASRTPVTLLLPTTPVGPGDLKPTPTGALIRNFARGRIFASPPGDGGLNLVAVEDVASAHVCALAHGRSGKRYTIGSENIAFSELWQMLAEVTGVAAPRRRIPYALAIAIGYVDEARCRVLRNAHPLVPLEGVRLSRERLYVNADESAAELGYSRSSVRAALVRAVTWYRENGYLN